MLYLASPYSHPDIVVRQSRYESARQAAEWLMMNGTAVFSPIAYSHHMRLPGDWEFWARIDEDFIARMDGVLVLMLDGWEQSVGVAAEIAIATRLGKNVQYIHEGLGFRP